MVRVKWGETMKNIMNINGYDAVITYDPEIEMFRGEFINLNGGADFYAADIKGLHKEGSTSLEVFLKMCEEDGVAPKKNYSGKFNVRISPKLHEHLVLQASATGKSINQLVVESLSSSVSGEL
jgi:predicted HicB family RNase H-like nuclease